MRISLTTAYDTLAAADEIVDLARNDARAQTLAACAVLALAAALEQGINFVLQAAAFRWDDNEDPTRNPFRKFALDSLRKKMIGLPGLLSRGAFRLSRSSVHVSALHELISLRNELAHVTDEPKEFQADDPRIQLDGSLLIVQIGRLESPWRTVDLRMASRFQEAVRRYLDDVVAHPDTIAAGELIEPTMPDR